MIYKGTEVCDTYYRSTACKRRVFAAVYDLYDYSSAVAVMLHTCRSTWIRRSNWQDQPCGTEMVRLTFLVAHWRNSNNTQLKTSNTAVVVRRPQFYRHFTSECHHQPTVKTGLRRFTPVVLCLCCNYICRMTRGFTQRETIQRCAHSGIINNEKSSYRWQPAL